MKVMEKIMQLDRIAAALEGINEKLGRLIPSLPESYPVGPPDLKDFNLTITQEDSFWNEKESALMKLREFGFNRNQVSDQDKKES